MKKVSMMLAAVVMLAACAKTENLSVNEGVSPISFDSKVVNPTKALYEIGTLTEFNVTALKPGQVGANAIFFTNEKVTVAQVGGAYKGTMEHKFFWDATVNSLAFYAYAPTSLNATASINATEKKIEYTSLNDQNSTKVETSYDMIVASKTSNEIDEVPLNFVHALSQIELQAKIDDAASYKVEVAGVKLIGFNSKGTFNYVDDITGTPSDLDPTTADDPEKPILGKEIKFSVTLEAWAEENKDINM